jgi:hypothetical protein
MPSTQPDISSVLELSDQELLDKGYLVLNEVCPAILRWGLIFAVLVIWAGVGGLVFSPTHLLASMVAIFGGIALSFTFIGLASLRLLLQLHRLHLEIQILAAQLPGQAASLIAHGLNIPGAILEHETGAKKDTGAPRR